MEDFDEDYEQLAYDNYLLRIEVVERGYKIAQLEAQNEMLKKQIQSTKEQKVAALLKAKEE